MKWNSGELDQAISAQKKHFADVEFESVQHDSRKFDSKEVFVALKGESFDGHDFVPDVLKKGAKGIIVHDEDIFENLPGGITKILVEDTTIALGELARHQRRKFNPFVVAITGSNGKSSTKEFAQHLISSQFETLSPQGSFNNQFGVPFTLLGLKPIHKRAVIEMGMNHPGEIAELCKIAEPDAVLVTTVGRAHIGMLGSIENIAKAKQEIYESSSDQAVKIFNLDNKHTLKMWRRFKDKSPSITFSQVQPDADVHFKEVVSKIDSLTVCGKIAGEPGEVTVPVFGRHNVVNLMAAAACALAAGLRPKEIWQSLPQCRGIWGRNQLVTLKSGANALFDAYNSNPDSFSTLVDNVKRLKLTGDVYGIFADMLELGEDSEQLHEELGEKASELPFQNIVFIGEYADSFERGYLKKGRAKNIVISNTYEISLADQMADMLKPGDIVLIKGSRGLHLERALERLGAQD